jgi:hypothetical protein
MPLLQHNNFPLYIFFSPSPKRQVGEDFQIFTKESGYKGK